MSPEPAIGHLSLQSLWDHRMHAVPLAREALRHLSACTECLWVLRVCQISATIEDARRSCGELSGRKPGAVS
jgi:hypothetical protein